MYLDGIHIGQTPMMISLKRNMGHELKFQLEGYTTYSVGLRRKIDGWVWGNLVFGGLLGVAIDAATGSIYRLSPSDLYPELHPMPAGGSGRELSIVVTLHPDPSWEKIGQLTATR